MEKLLRTNDWTRAREKPQNLVHTEEPAPTQPAHTCTTENKRWGTDWLSDNQMAEKTHQRKTHQQPKLKYIHRAHINHSPRSVRSGDQGHGTQNLTGILPQKFTPKTQWIRTEQLKKQRLSGRVSQTTGRQRNNPQMKGKEEVSETMLNEKEASQLSDIEFKALVIRKLNELTENYQKL